MPATISLKAGGVGDVDLKIVNESPRSLRIERWKSGCDCLTVSIPREGVSISPRATATLPATIDLRSDPTNPRSFAPEVEFFGDGLLAPLVAKIEVEVQKP